MHIAANGKKTATQDIGTIWEFGFKVDPIPESDDDQHHPVQVRVNRPDDQTSTVIPVLDGKAYTVLYALDVPGEYIATVVGEGPDGDVSQLGGFTATALPVDAAIAGAEAATEVDPKTQSDPIDPPRTGTGSGLDEWVAFARAKGATDDDLLDADGGPLGRDALADKYGTPPA